MIHGEGRQLYREEPEFVSASRGALSANVGTGILIIVNRTVLFS